jgi:hypothetical protein
MKKFVLKELNDFIEIANAIDTPFKFYFENEKLEAIIHLRTFLISWVGEKGEEREKMLKENGFKKAEEIETRKMLFEDFL